MKKIKHELMFVRKVVMAQWVVTNRHVMCAGTWQMDY